MTMLDPRTARILVRGVNWIGDAVMTTPALTALRAHCPAAEITLLANPLVSQLLSPHPAIDRVITFDRTGCHRGAVGRLRLAAEVRRQRFQAAVILPNSFDSALVPWLAGIPVRLGKASDGRSLLLTGRYRPDEAAMGHEVEYYLDLVRYFGAAAVPSEPHLQVTGKEQEEARATLAAQGIQESEFLIGVNPGATFGSAKRWYPERFADAARRLADQWNARIAIFGGGGETDIAAAIEQHLAGRCLNMAGKTSVRQLMALIGRCGFFITNDSGPMHIAAALGVPLVAVFGPTDHTGTAPYTHRGVIVRKDTDCAPCKLRECPTDHRCMTAVTADDVVAAGVALMEKMSLQGREP